MNGEKSIGIMLSVKRSLIFQASVRQAKRLRRRMLIINCRAILGRWCISVLGIFLSGGFSMGERVGGGISGKDYGIAGLLIERLEG